MNRIKLIALLIATNLMLGCEKKRVDSISDCFGIWQLSENPRKNLMINEHGRVEFFNLIIQDIGGDRLDALPRFGSCKLTSNNEIIEFWFDDKGGDYGQGGNIVFNDGFLEIWFSVGDPDSYEWKKFRKIHTPE